MGSMQSDGTCIFLEMLSIPDSHAIKATAITTTIIGFFSSLAAVMGNFAVLAVLFKHQNLQTPSNLLIGSLCVSDFLTGLSVTPLSSTRRLYEAFHGHPCTVRLICAFFSFFCLSTSIVAVGEISVDRYFAITMPFRYQRNATNSRYMLIVCISWLLLGILSILPFLRGITAMAFFRMLFALMGLVLVIFLYTNTRISQIVKSQRRRIHTMCHVSTVTNESRNNDRAIVMREGRKANTIAILISVALISYVPLAVMFILRGTIGDTIELVAIADPWADLFLQVNSAVNPFIYCLRTKEIRDAVLRMMPMSVNLFLTRIFQIKR